MTAWIRNYIYYKMKDNISYPFPNFNSATLEVWRCISNPPCTLQARIHLSILGIKLIHVSKRGPWIPKMEALISHNPGTYNFLACNPIFSPTTVRIAMIHTKDAHNMAKALMIMSALFCEIDLHAKPYKCDCFCDIRTVVYCSIA